MSVSMELCKVWDSAAEREMVRSGGVSRVVLAKVALSNPNNFIWRKFKVRLILDKIMTESEVSLAG